MKITHTLPQAANRPVSRQLAHYELYDLLLVASLGLCLPLLLLLPPAFGVLRVPLGLVMALGAPGYALQAALFPGREDLDGVMRAALSFGLSIALLPLLALLLDNTPWGIRPMPIAWSLTIWLVLVCSIAVWQRQAALGGGAAHLPVPLAPKRWWHALGPLERRRFVAWGLASVVVLALAGFALNQTRPEANLTEFAILGRTGLAEDYPRTAVVGEDLTVNMAIANGEQAEQTYRVEVWAVQPLVSDQRELIGQTESITLAPGQQQAWPVSWQMPWAGDDQRVDFLLFTADGTQPYRELHLWLNVGQ